MQTTICFLNDKIIAMSGEMKGNKICVSDYKIYELKEGSIINGVITNNFAVKATLEAIKSKPSLYNKGRVSVIIDSSLIFIKHANFSLTSRAKMEILAENEFSGLENQGQELIYDYSIIKPSWAKTASISCYAVEKSLVNSFSEIFEEVKIPIKRIDISYNCIEKFTSIVKSLGNSTYVIANVDKNNMMLMLFVDGQFYYSTRARLLSDYGTDAFYLEIATNLSSINQFNKAQRKGHEIEKVFLCGISDIENMNCTSFIKDIGLTNESTKIFEINIKYSKNIRSVNTNDLIYNIGSLIRK